MTETKHGVFEMLWTETNIGDIGAIENIPIMRMI